MLEATNRVMQHSKEAIALQAKLESENRAKSLTEVRVKELEEQVQLAKRDTTLIIQRFQTDLRNERQVRTCFQLEIISFSS